MSENPGQLTRQTIVKLDPALHKWLMADAEANGRTVDMTIRHYLRVAKAKEAKR